MLFENTQVPRYRQSSGVFLPWCSTHYEVPHEKASGFRAESRQPLLRAFSPTSGAGEPVLEDGNGGHSHHLSLKLSSDCMVRVRMQRVSSLLPRPLSPLRRAVRRTLWPGLPSPAKRETIGSGRRRGQQTEELLLSAACPSAVTYWRPRTPKWSQAGFGAMKAIGCKHKQSAC